MRPLKKSEENLKEIVKRIHEKVIVIDTHDTTNIANYTDGINYIQRLENRSIYQKMIVGGLDMA